MEIEKSLPRNQSAEPFFIYFKNSTPSQTHRKHWRKLNHNKKRIIVAGICHISASVCPKLIVLIYKGAIRIIRATFCIF